MVILRWVAPSVATQLFILKEILMFRRLMVIMAVATLLILPGIAAAQAQAPAQAPAATPAPAQPQPGPGLVCPMAGQMTPEQMKQMQEKMGKMCGMQPGQGCPMHQQMQKQLDELRQRVEALEGKKKGKKK
jgi:ABC-type Fe3+-hydroxamate transport system substrate-binding protein